MCQRQEKASLCEESDTNYGTVTEHHCISVKEKAENCTNVFKKLILNNRMLMVFDGYEHPSYSNETKTFIAH